MPVLHRTEHGAVWGRESSAALVVAWLSRDDGESATYRVLDLERLCWRLRAGSLADLQKNLETSLAERIARNGMKRQPCWTESLAVGSQEFVQKAESLVNLRRATEIVAAGERAWALREQPVFLTAQERGPKRVLKAHHDMENRVSA